MKENLNMTKSKTNSLKFKIGGHVTYRRRNRDQEPLGLVRGIIESLTRTTCVMLDTATGEPVAASLNRVSKAGS